MTLDDLRWVTDEMPGLESLRHYQTGAAIRGLKLHLAHFVLVLKALIGRHGIESLSGLMGDKTKERVNANHYQ